MVRIISTCAVSAELLRLLETRHDWWEEQSGSEEMAEDLVVEEPNHEIAEVAFFPQHFLLQIYILHSVVMACICESLE